MINALMTDNMDFDIIIGLPTIQSYHLLDILDNHIKSLPQLCQISSKYSPNLIIEHNSNDIIEEGDTQYIPDIDRTNLRSTKASELT